MDDRRSRDESLRFRCAGKIQDRGKVLQPEEKGHGQGGHKGEIHVG